MSRQALGKGLGALIRKNEARAAAAAENEVDESRVLLAKVDEIQPSPFQPRRTFNDEQISELAASIRERGLVQPLVVRRVNGKLELIAGERRLRAMKLLGKPEVKVVMMEATDREVAELALIENLQREDLTPLEEAEQYRLLQSRFGMKQEIIAQHVGKSRAVVANMVRLLELVPTARELLEKEEISVGHAKVLLQLKDAAQQAAAATRVAKQGLTVRQTEQLVKDILNPDPARPQIVSKVLPAAYESVCQQLSSDFGTKVNIALKGKSNGVIEISYTGRDELVRILQLFGVNAPV
ncbi:MAG: ParB/RepB/Spo0J family partition protein [Akkermansia sp.]|nr:ParB/RepB/Spo0J family partition protein [Akkermansia sp.]